MPPPNRPTTINDIARKTGLSKSTVSCALRNRPEVSLATQQLVHQTAKEMGYHRNAAFASLGTRAYQHSHARQGLPLGYLWQRRPNNINFHDPQLLSGLESKCRDLGYHLESFCLDDFRSNDHFLQLVVNRGLTGLIVGHLRDDKILFSPKLKTLALIAAGFHRLNLPIHTVKDNAYEIAYETLLKIHAKGYRKILVLQYWHENTPMNDDFLRYAGTMAAKLKIDSTSSGWIRIENRPEMEVPAWKKMISKHKPDAIIGFNDADFFYVHAAGFMRSKKHAFAARACVMNNYGHPNIVVSGMAAHSKEVGKSAVEWVDQLIRLGTLGIPTNVRSLVVRPEWREGTTTPDKNPI